MASQRETVYLIPTPHKTSKRKNKETISIVRKAVKQGSAAWYSRDLTFPADVLNDETGKKRTTLEAGYHVASSLIMRIRQMENDGEHLPVRSQVIVQVWDDHCLTLFKCAVKYAKSGQRPSCKFSWLRFEEWALLKLCGEALCILENLGFEIDHVLIAPDFSATITTAIPVRPTRPSEADAKATVALMLFKADLAKGDGGWHARYKRQAEVHTNAAAQRAVHDTVPAVATIVRQDTDAMQEEIAVIFDQHEEQNKSIGILQATLAMVRDQHDMVIAAGRPLDKVKDLKRRTLLNMLGILICHEEANLEASRVATDEYLKSLTSPPAVSTTPKPPVPQPPMRAIRKMVMAHTTGKSDDVSPSPDIRELDAALGTSLPHKRALDTKEAQPHAEGSVKKAKRTIEVTDAGDMQNQSATGTVHQLKRSAGVMEASAHGHITAEGAGSNKVVDKPGEGSGPNKKQRT